MRPDFKKGPKKEIVIDLGNVQYCYGYYNLLIKKLELPIITAPTEDGMSDFLREPWLEDRNVRFINYSKTSKDIKDSLPITLKMFERVKEFQKNCGCEFTWSVED